MLERSNAATCALSRETTRSTPGVDASPGSDSDTSAHEPRRIAPEGGAISAAPYPIERNFFRVSAGTPGPSSAERSGVSLGFQCAPAVLGLSGRGMSTPR